MRLEGTTSNRVGDRREGHHRGRRPPADGGGEKRRQLHLAQRIRGHFGLGAATGVDRVTIRWPSGMVDTATALQPDRFYLAREGQGITPIVTRR